MIGNALLIALWTILEFVTRPIRNLSEVDLSTGIVGALNSAIESLWALDYIIPVGTFLIVVGIVVSYEIAYFGFKFIMWLIRRFPTQS